MGMPGTHRHPKRPTRGKANRPHQQTRATAARDGTVPKTARHVRLSRSTRASAKRIGTDDHDLLRVLAQASLKPAPSEQKGAARNPAGH
jgi:hypothetical protein